MAKLIPTQIKKVPTLIDIKGNFKTKAILRKHDEMPKYWTDVREHLFSGEKYNLFGKDIIVVSRRIGMSVGMWELDIDFRFSDVLKSMNDAHEWAGEMKKYGEVCINISKDYIEYEVPEYIKYDFDHTYCAGRGTLARVTDELPTLNKEIFFKVFIYKPRKYYCCDCNDYHTTNDEITERILPTKKDAFTFIKSWSGSKRLRRKENNI